MAAAVDSAPLHRAAALVADASAVTVLTGAGISTDSGIPDFRGPRGLWTLNPASERMFSLDAYVADPEVRIAAWGSRRDHPAWKARPNEAHAALVRLERAGKLRALVTQNIDGLHQKAGSSPEQVVEIHGSVFGVECLGCGDHTRMVDAIARVDAGEVDPRCAQCGGILKSATISFGQALRPADIRAAVAAAQTCDVFLAIGSSLSVQPAASLCDVARSSGAAVVIVNAEPTPYDEVADVVVRDPIATAVPTLVG